MRYKNEVEFMVYGRYALFTDPVTKIGGEKFSYQIPTYQALKGVLESIYWKPTFIWVIDAVRIMQPIRTQAQGMRPIHYQDNKNDLSIYTYLKDVCYKVRAHFEWNENRPDLAKDRNEHKHWDIAKRMISRGGRRDIFLGTRECQAYVEPTDFEEEDGYYDTIDMDFGMMVHGITYPDEQQENGSRQLTVRLWSPSMQQGCIRFIRPEECPVQNPLDGYTQKAFIPGQNFSGLAEFEEGGSL